MKNTTKFFSLLLSMVLAVSAFAGNAVFHTNAADGEQRIYFRFPDDSVWRHEGLKITARTGKANVYCYAYNIYGHKGNNGKYNTGWQTRTTQCDAEPEGGAITDATLFSFNLASVGGGIEEGADYGVIFSTKAIDQNRTCDLTMSTDCIGSTVYVTPYTDAETDETYTIRENASDSHRVDYYAAWMYPDGTKREDYGPKAAISSLGVLMPGLYPNNQPRAAMLSDELKKHLTNPVNYPYFQYDNNMVLCQELGVTPKAVYDQYLADNEEIIADGEASEYPHGEVDPKVPVPFYRYMDENDQGQIVEKKLAVPSAVKEVLGITDETTTEEPTTEEPTTEEPTTEEPTTEEPTTEEPTTEEPTTEEPTTEEPTTVPPTPTELIIGDVNGDGVVTISDATAIQRFAIGLNPHCYFNNKLADVNNDGMITIRDASCVQRYAAEYTNKIGNAGKLYEDITPASDDPKIIG